MRGAPVVRPSKQYNSILFKSTLSERCIHQNYLSLFCVSIHSLSFSVTALAR